MILSSRSMVILLACCWLVVGLMVPTTYGQPKAKARITVFVAKKIITMENSPRSATTVAVAKGKILAVGSLQQVKQQLGKRTYKLDRTFERKVVMPGFIDPHLHPWLGALLLPMEIAAPDPWDLPGRKITAVRGRAAFLKQFKAYEGSRKTPDEWLFVWGYHQYFHGEVTRKDLDAISNTRPIVSWHRSFHEIYLNTPALKALKITKEKVKGNKHVDFEKGWFYEHGLLVAAPELLPILFERNRWKGGLEKTRQLFHHGGITSVADMAAYAWGPREFEFLKEVLGNDKTPFRVYLIADGRGPYEKFKNHPELAVKHVLDLHKKSTHRLKFIRSVKLFSDGAFFSQLMQMFDGYTDGHKGAWIMEPKDLMRAAEPFWNAGFQIHVHTNGDAGLAVTLNTLEKLQRMKRRKDHRFCIEHFGYSRKKQCKRLADLGATVSANPYYLYCLGDKYAEIGLGPKRAPYIVRAASVLKNNRPLALHSDMLMAPAQPLLLAWCAVNRRGMLSGKVLGPEEKISVHQALRAITIDAAYVLRQEKEIGSIAVGKNADFTILEEDPYTVKPMAIKDIQVWGTVFEGNVYPVKRGN